MAEITTALIKALREETNQGMMECKKALTETNGDVEAAKDLLRKKGLVKAGEKATRVIKEGLIGMKVLPGAAVMVEVRCESDFCARNDVFGAMVTKVVELAAAAPAGPIAATPAMEAAVQEAFAKIGENMSYARGVKIVAPRIGSYLHHNKKVGVLVGLEGEVTDQTLNDLCMHIAFADPVAIRPEDVPAELVEKERAFAAEEAAASGKPAEIVAKMVEGKVRKFLASNALLEQPFVRDEKMKVSQIVGKAKVVAFARFAVGA